jgi:HD-GYP domain-containing protein (c-di-GMP phosphodiesterase class II)
MRAPSEPDFVRGLPPADTGLLRIMILEEQLAKMRAGTICALNEMLDLKDLSTGMHSSRLAEWAVRIGERLGIMGSDLADLEAGAILHDIGKNGVSESILNKPSQLNPKERKEIEKHSEYGWAILRVIPGFEKTSLLVLHHHERMDGRGYPAGLSAEEIPLGSKIIAVIDSFDAMVSDRTYRKGLEIAEAIRRLCDGMGSQFDEHIVGLFVPIAERESSKVNSSVSIKET